MKIVDYEAKVGDPVEMPIAAPEFGNARTMTESVAAIVGWRIWERRRAIGKKLGIFLAVVTITLFLIPNSYESTTTLMPPDSGDNIPLALGSLFDQGGGAGGSGGGGGGGSVLGGIAGSLLGMKNQGDVFIGVLQSDIIENRLIDRFDLRRVYWTKYYKSAREELESRTTVTADRKSGIITITVSDHQADRAQQLAQAYVEELDHVMAKVSTSAARRERIFLEDRLKQAKQDLDQAAKQLGEFSSKNTTMNLDEQAKAMVETQGSLTGQLIAAESELAGLQQIYSDNNVRVKSLKAQIAGLNDQIAKFGGTPGSSTERIPGIEAPTLRALPLVGTVYADYYRRAKIQETIFELLTQEYEIAKVQEAKDLPPVRVLDPADLPEHKASPPRGRLLLLGALLGCFFVVGWVWGEYRWEKMDEEDRRKVAVTELKYLAITVVKSTTESARHIWRRLRRTPQPESEI